MRQRSRSTRRVTNQEAKGFGATYELLDPPDRAFDDELSAPMERCTKRLEVQKMLPGAGERRSAPGKLCGRLRTPPPKALDVVRARLAPDRDLRTEDVRDLRGHGGTVEARKCKEAEGGEPGGSEHREETSDDGSLRFLPPRLRIWPNLT